MRGGHVDAVSRTQISGWAADSAQPDRRLELAILVDGVEAGRTLAQRPRPDLAKLGRYGDGGHGFAFVFPQPLDSKNDHVVSVRFAEDMRVLPNGERSLARGADADAVSPPAAAVAAPAAQRDAAIAGPDPILVTAPGRSGTTYLMGCLAASPQVVVAELVPYEVRLLSYYAAAFGVLTAAANTEQSTHPDRLEGDGFHIGFNPFSGPQYAHAFRGKAMLDQFHQSWAPTRLGTAMADIVREYYRRLALDRGKGTVPFFAEKNNNLHQPSRLFVRRLFDQAREIVIVRDPRDVLCSHVAYFSSTQEKAFNQLSHSCRQLSALADAAGADLCVIRYEDMIRGEAATYSRLTAFLGATVQPVDTASGGTMFQKHGTSETPEASIGRWRHDLPEALQAQSTQAWHGFLEKFRYDLT